MRNVKVSTFNGPLDLLLQLIEQQELDITQISLSKVTEQYIAELQKMTELPVDELADFLVIAAKLVLIKSKLMIGSEVEPDEVGLDLERQLRMYREFVEAAKNVNAMFNKRKVAYPRDSWVTMEPMFNPPEHITVGELESIFHDVLKELEPITRLPQTVMVRTINIREKINHIKDHLLQVKQTSLRELLQHANSKTDIIITFLALLELVKQRDITLAQETMYGEVSVHALEQDPVNA
jgi:segregation and condensation protein A